MNILLGILFLASFLTLLFTIALFAMEVVEKTTEAIWANKNDILKTQSKHSNTPRARRAAKGFFRSPFFAYLMALLIFTAATCLLTTYNEETKEDCSAVNASNVSEIAEGKKLLAIPTSQSTV